MYLDPRGGHNRKEINQNFFKNWSAQMSYVLGLIYADGAVEDVRKSSRTCYITITSKDKSLLQGVKRTMSSTHKLYQRGPKPCIFHDGKKTYLSSKTWTLRIGNKLIYRDLLGYGLTPRKSLTLKFPNIPDKYLNFFIRGYFDGDGNISVYTERGKITPRVRTTFISGSKNFLKTLENKIASRLNVGRQRVYTVPHGFHLCYSKHDSLKILKFTHSGLRKAPYLQRKYKIYQNYLKNYN